MLYLKLFVNLYFKVVFHSCDFSDTPPTQPPRKITSSPISAEQLNLRLPSLSFLPLQRPTLITMQAQNNPVKMLKRSKHKTIEDLQNEVRANQSAVQNLWKLKEKEHKFWKEGLCEKEVGWCRDHRNFCDVNSTCDLWDPIPASSAEGRLTYIKNRCFSFTVPKRVPISGTGSL